MKVSSKKPKTQDWSFLLQEEKPTSKQRLELKKIKESLSALEIDFEGFDLDTEESFREFVLARTTPGESVVEFLKDVLQGANIAFDEKGFRRMDKQRYLQLFFDLFDLGANEGDSASSVATDSPKAGADTENGETPVEEPVGDEFLTAAKMDGIYKTWTKEPITTISYAEIVVTNSIPVRAQDNFSLRLRDNAPDVTHRWAALVSASTGKTVAVGHLEGDKREPKLVFAAEDIAYDSVKENRKHEIILFPRDASENKFYSVSCEIGFQELEETSRTLCIDFGTSNTTAGSYGILDEQANQPEIVKFPDVAGTSTPQMLPTLVYVASCPKGEEIRYAFGYEAQKRIREDHFEDKATVFHEIKSWMNDLNHDEEIKDSQGNNNTVRREDVIKAYLHYVISLSEQYFHKRFKYLHFSAPVKLKESFLGKMREMFPEYLVLKDSVSIDEGIAIVYNHIAKRIESMSDGEHETVFVIDCGGGTTDLAKCEYEQTAADIGEGRKKLTVTTSFENGDSAFGGNNITYRILQLLKIKIDARLQEQPAPDMLKTLSDNEISIMTKLDSASESKDTNIFAEKEKIYQAFETAYHAAEEHIPTRYQEAVYSDDKRYMRRNYNYLWQMAESIKIEFFKSSSTVSMEFSKEEDRNLCIGGQEDYYLYVRKDRQSALEKRTAPLQDIEITIKEVSRIICPDIYALLSVLLGEYENQELQEVNYYRLSGQSCNITLFHDLMKEFVPGRMIRRDSGKIAEKETTGKESVDESVDNLKIACIEGSIRYLMAKEFSHIQPEIQMAVPKMLYTVSQVEVGGDGKETIALDNDKATPLPQSRSGRRARFVVRDIYGQEKNNIYYDFETDEGKMIPSTLADLKAQLTSSKSDTYWGGEKIENIIRALNDIELHSTAENKRCVFLLPSQNGYGFRVYQALVSYDEKTGATKYLFSTSQAGGKIYGEYYSFEKMASFFDGKR